MPFDCLQASYQLIHDLRRPLAEIRRVDARLHTQLRTAAPKKSAPSCPSPNKRRRS